MSTYTFLPWGFSHWQDSPYPHSLLLTCSQAGSTGGWAEMACRGKPTRPTGGEQHLSPPFKRQSLLKVSELDQGNARSVSRPQLPSVHLSPLRWGKTVGLRTSVSQIQASAVLPQSEANAALGFRRQDDGCHRSLARGQPTERGHDSGSRVWTQDVSFE